MMGNRCDSGNDAHFAGKHRSYILNSYMASGAGRGGHKRPNRRPNIICTEVGSSLGLSSSPTPTPPATHTTPDLGSGVLIIWNTTYSISQEMNVQWGYKLHVMKNSHTAWLINILSTLLSNWHLCHEENLFHLHWFANVLFFYIIWWTSTGYSMYKVAG